MVKELSVIVAANVRALLGIKDGESGVGALIGKGMSNGNAQRVLEGATDFQISRVADLARMLGVEPWQMLVPGMNPADRPRLVFGDKQPGWPFDFAYERFSELRDKEKGMVEYAARSELERIEIERKRKAPASNVDEGDRPFNQPEKRGLHSV